MQGTLCVCARDRRVWNGQVLTETVIYRPGDKPTGGGWPWGARQHPVLVERTKTLFAECPVRSWLDSQLDRRGHHLQTGLDRKAWVPKLSFCPDNTIT